MFACLQTVDAVLGWPRYARAYTVAVTVLEHTEAVMCCWHIHDARPFQAELMSDDFSHVYCVCFKVSDPFCSNLKSKINGDSHYEHDIAELKSYINREWNTILSENSLYVNHGCKVSNLAGNAEEGHGACPVDKSPVARNTTFKETREARVKEITLSRKLLRNYWASVWYSTNLGEAVCIIVMVRKGGWCNWWRNGTRY